MRNFVTGETKPLEFLRDLKIGSICGIAMPESFESALTGLGAKIEVAKIYADHHRYTAREIENFIRRCERKGVGAIITTEKDAVRIPRLLEPEVPIYYLRVEIEILAGQESWQRFVDRLTIRRPVVAPQRFY